MTWMKRWYLTQRNEKSRVLRCGVLHFGNIARRISKVAAEISLSSLSSLIFNIKSYNGMDPQLPWLRLAEPADELQKSYEQFLHLGWMRMAEPVMKSYTKATDGSGIERKESALVWHYQDANPGFDYSQAKKMLDHLESVLANEPIVVN